MFLVCFLFKNGIDLIDLILVGYMKILCHINSRMFVCIIDILINAILVVFFEARNKYLVIYVSIFTWRILIYGDRVTYHINMGFRFQLLIHRFFSLLLIEMFSRRIW